MGNSSRFRREHFFLHDFANYNKIRNGGYRLDRKEKITMADKEKLITQLQGIATAAAQQADGHAIQSRIFKAQGFKKLAKKYAGHAKEERGYVRNCIDRIIDLGGDVKNGAKQETPTYNDPIEWVKYDLQVSKDGLPGLAQAIEDAKTDYTTYDLLKEYYEDEEEDLYWGENQLELMEKIGQQNWLLKQM